MSKSARKRNKLPGIPVGKAEKRTTNRLTVMPHAKLSAAAGLLLAAGTLGENSAFGQKDEGVAAFTYHAPQSTLDDLKLRLAQTRWPERETTNDWSEGVPLEKMHALVDYWQTG